ncbi:MAG: GtrA family protein [Verrucomicrobiaceae bacterium]
MSFRFDQCFLTREIAKAWQYFRTQGLRTTLLSRDTPFLIQFGKYGACGVASVIVFLIVANLGQLLFPASFSLDLAPAERAKNIIFLHFAAFLPSNFAAYALNRWLVFTPGRHSARKEISLFTLISFISFSLGEILPIWLINSLNVPNQIAHLSFVLSSALVNFVCRKFLVFEK